MRKLLIIVVLLSSMVSNSIASNSKAINIKHSFYVNDSINVSIEKLKCRIDRNKSLLKQYTDDLKFYKKFINHFKPYSVKRNVYSQKIKECLNNIDKTKILIKRDSNLLQAKENICCLK